MKALLLTFKNWTEIDSAPDAVPKFISQLEDISQLEKKEFNEKKC